MHSGDVNCFGFLFWMCLLCQIGAFHADALKHLKAATGCHEMSFKWGKPPRENLSTAKMKGVNSDEVVCSDITMPWAQVNVGC